VQRRVVKIGHCFEYEQSVDRIWTAIVHFENYGSQSELTQTVAVGFLLLVPSGLLDG
jgi:hypothetical protein